MAPATARQVAVRMDRLLELTFHAEQSHFWFRGFRRFVTPWLVAAANGRSDLRLLDCGCGTGANLTLLGRHGRAFGFDLTMRGLELGRQQQRTRIARASIGAIPHPDSTFDVVTSFDVLYGLPDEIEQAAAREIARVLKPGGAAVVSTAAFESLRGAHGTFANEVRRYTRSSLAELLTRHGLHVERTAYTHATLFPLIYAVRAWQRWRGGGTAAPSEAEISVPSWPVNTALTAALVVESWAQRVVSMPFGSSVICLARKPR